MICGVKMKYLFQSRHWNMERKLNVLDLGTVPGPGWALVPISDIAEGGPAGYHTSCPLSWTWAADMKTGPAHLPSSLRVTWHLIKAPVFAPVPSLNPTLLIKIFPTWNSSHYFSWNPDYSFPFPQPCTAEGLHFSGKQIVGSFGTTN